MDVGQKKAGWIEVIAGSMFSGKSEELIRRLRRAHPQWQGEARLPRREARLMERYQLMLAPVS